MRDKAPTFATMGASSHAENPRNENDFYATEPRAVELLLGVETFSDHIFEPCAGAGHISKVLEENGFCVESRDLVDRGFCDGGFDFLASTEKFDGDIISNPPYKQALQFCKKAIETITDGHKVAMFLKLLFWEGKERKKFFALYPPRTVYVSSSRLNTARNGEFGKYPSSSVCYAWFVWEKGYNGDTVIRWIN